MPTATTPAEPKTRSRPARVAFENEIVSLVYAPAIRQLLREAPANVTMLARAFSERYTCTCSPGTMAGWLKLAGITCTKTTNWEEGGPAYGAPRVDPKILGGEALYKPVPVGDGAV